MERIILELCRLAFTKQVSHGSRVMLLLLSDVGSLMTLAGNNIVLHNDRVKRSKQLREVSSTLR